MNKKAQKGIKTGTLLVILAVVALALDLGGVRTSLFGAEEAAPVEPAAKAPAVVETCASNTQPSITFLAVNKHQTGTSLSGNVVYRIKENGGDTYSAAAVGALGTGIDLAVGQEVQYYINATNYYASKPDTYVVPCKTSASKTVSLLAFDTGVGMSVENPTNKNINTLTTDEEPMSAGATKTFFITAEGASKQGIQDAIIVCEFNRTVINSLDSSLPDADTPEQFTVSTTGYKDAAWSLGTIENNQRIEYSITVEADSVNDPSGTGADILCDLIDQGTYQHTVDGTFEYGPDTNLDNDVAGTQAKQEFGIYIS